ncbi:MAG: replicative DNA helicase [Clostridiales bacterium]|nr:replicative DNA helicase [Clostridiales bacterium]
MADYQNELEAYEQQMPYNLEAEQSVLGAILIDPSNLSRVMGELTPDCFYRSQHREIFSIMFRMFSSGGVLDNITIFDEVINEHIFDSPETAKQYMVQLMEIVPSTANIEVYAKIVREKYYLRALIDASKEIISNATEGSGTANQLLDMAEQRIYDIRQGRSAEGLVRIDEVIIQSYDTLQKLSGEDKADYLGIPTGFDRLDTVITGLNKSDLLIIAARPAMGKTSFALNIASHVGKKSGKEVAIFSLEMSNDQLVSRLLSAEGQISSYNLRTGELTPDEWVRLASAAEILSRAEIYLSDTPNISVAEMKAKLRRQKNLGLVVIDYLQLMSTGRKDGNRVQEISEITRNLKIMAKELNVPVVTLSQLGRGPDSRTDHRPLLSDLRESGSIEQDADVVMFLYRDEYYNKETEDHNIAECIVAKNRHGEADTVKLAWDGQFTRFSNLELYRDEPQGY